MANKTASIRKPISSGTKGFICLAVLCAVLVFVSIISLTGMSLDSEGVNILLPWVPASGANWPESLPLDRTLGGGSYTEYSFALDEGASADQVAKVIKDRLVNLGEADSSVAVKGDVIRVELRDMQASLRSSKLNLCVMPAHFEFTDPNGEAVLTEKDVADVKTSVKSGTSTYTVSMEFTLTKEGQQKVKDADPAYLAVTCDGESLSSFASVSGAKVTASLGTGDSAYNAASNYTFLARYGAVDATLTQTGTGKVNASADSVLTVVVLLCAALLVCALVYLMISGKLTGLSAFLGVWAAVVLSFFFLAAVVVPSSTMVTIGILVAVLLGVVLAMFSAVTRVDAVSKQIYEGGTPKQATKLGLKNAAKTVWIAHGGMMALALILMIFGFSRNIGYTLCMSVLASALSTLVMRAFQLCFIAITNKPALYGKTK